MASGHEQQGGPGAVRRAAARRTAALLGLTALGLYLLFILKGVLGA